MAALEPFEQFLQRPRGLVIGGIERPAASDQWFDVQNPANGQLLATVADSGAADVHAAVEADERIRQGTRPRGAGFLPADEDRVDRPVVSDNHIVVRGAA